jgi:K+-transporting ATPase A subunit
MANNIWYSYSNMSCITYYVSVTSMGYTRCDIVIIFGKPIHRKYHKVVLKIALLILTLIIGITTWLII